MREPIAALEIALVQAQELLMLRPCLRKHGGARSAIAAAMLVLTAPIAALAQGGKAEPLRIAFKRGTSSSTIRESVRGDEEAEYVLAARQGQRLTIKLTSVPDKSSVFKLLSEGNDKLELLHDVDFNYSRVLPKTGDYFITVKRSSDAKGTSRYRLVVAVR